LPREKLWVNFLANNQELSERLDLLWIPLRTSRLLRVGVSHLALFVTHRRVTGSLWGLRRSGSEPLRAEAVGQSVEHPCVWC
jgi:hypothetical protein